MPEQLPLGEVRSFEMSQDRRRRVMSEFDRMRSEMDRLFRTFVTPGTLPSLQQRGCWRPLTDVFETESHAIIKVEVAGMRGQDFHISLSDQMLTITGQRPDSLSEKKRAFQQMEISYGPFETEVYLPWQVDEDSVKAIYEDGFLIVTLPKAAVQKRYIPVTVVVKE